MRNTDPAAMSQTGSTELERALEPGELLEALKRFGFLDADIARSTNNGPRTVRRWKSSTPSASSTGRLDDLRSLVLRLRDSGGLTDDGIIFWLRHRNRLLEDYSPLDVLGVGGFESVRDAALAFVDPEREFTKPVPAALLRILEAEDRGDGDLGHEPGLDQPKVLEPR